MWNRSRETDRERNAREQDERIRSEHRPDDRPRGYFYFVAVVVIAVVAFVLLVGLS